MNEERYASRIRQALNHGLNEISPVASRRLEAARHLALSKQKQLAHSLELTKEIQAGNGSAVVRGPSHFPYARQILAVVALLVGMWLSFYWQSVQYINQIEEVDSALLSDDLPPEAFFDDDIFEWLKADDSLPD